MKKLSEIKIDKGWSSFLHFRDRKLQGVQTGIKGLDKALLGLGAFTVIQGGPKSNKSTLALQIAHHNLKEGMPCLILDRENGLERFRMRLICQANKVSQNHVLTCERTELRSLVKSILHYPLYVCTQPISDPEIINQAVGELYKLYGKPVLLVGDSLQAMPALDSDERISLQKWLGAFDQIKLNWEGKLTQILISEKSRGNYEQATTGGAKGTGNIEYKCETLLDLRRNSNGNIVVNCLENRDGANGMEVELSKVLANRSNPTSFTFLLEETEDDVEV